MLGRCAEAQYFWASVPKRGTAGQVCISRLLMACVPYKGMAGQVCRSRVFFGQQVRRSRMLQGK